MLTETDQTIKTAPPVSVSRRSLLTDDQQSELLYIRDTLLSSYFRIGDIANEAILSNSSRPDVFDHMVYDEVGVWVGKSGRTVRYYAESAAFFSPPVRSEYEMIPFTHFDLARNYQDDWRVILEISKTNPGMSLDRVRFLANAYFSEVRREACEENLSQDSDVRVRAYVGAGGLEELDSVLERVSAVERDKKKPLGQGASAPLVGRLMSLAAEVRQLVYEYGLSNEMEQELADCMGVLISLIPRIISEIDGKGERV